jgi:hypothetical protein
MSAHSANAMPTIAETEEAAAKALLFMVSDHGRLEQFGAATGLMPADLQRAASDLQLQAAVVDHLLEHEALLLAFAAEHSVQPERMAAIAHVLADLAAGRAPRQAAAPSKRFQPLYPLVRR